MKKRNLVARAGAAFVAACLIVVCASCQKVIGIEDLEVCKACYSGPSTTKDVGACHTGCPGDGGACVDEILPKTEDCSTADVDDNCDGKTACTGDLLWSLGGTTPGTITGETAVPQALLTLATSGDLVAVGSTHWGITLGGAKPPADDGKIVSFIGSIAPEGGAPIAVTTLVPETKDGEIVANDVAPLPGNVVAVGGSYIGTAPDIAGTKTPTKSRSGFVALYNLQDDHLIGGRSLQAGDDNSGVEVWAVAGTKTGDVYACGDFQGKLVLPDGSTRSSDAFTIDAFVLHYDNQGHLVDQAFFGGKGDDSCAFIDVGENGDVAITGYFGSDDFAIGNKLGAAGGDSDVFVALLSSHLEPKWALPLNDPDTYDNVAGVVFDPTNGNLLVGGDFARDLHIGDKSLQSAGQHDLFVAEIDATGHAVWARAYGDAADQEMSRIVVDGAGQAVISGSLAGHIHAEGCDVASLGGSAKSGADALVMKLLAGGDGAWCVRAGTGQGPEFASSVTTDGAGNVYVASTFFQTFAYPGGKQLACSGDCGTAFAFAKLEP